MQKYNNVRLNKQFIINNSNFSKNFSQLNYLTTEADLFKIYFNINFSSLNINIGISGLKLVLKITKIIKLKQTANSNSNMSEVFN